MIEAQVILHAHGEKVDWGIWSFAALPSSRHKIGLRAADDSLVYFRVREVEHHPVRDGERGSKAVLICDWEGEDLLDSEVEDLLSRPPPLD